VSRAFTCCLRMWRGIDLESMNTLVVSNEPVAGVMLRVKAVTTIWDKNSRNVSGRSGIKNEMICLSSILMTYWLNASPDVLDLVAKPLYSITQLQSHVKRSITINSLLNLKNPLSLVQLKTLPECHQCLPFLLATPLKSPYSISPTSSWSRFPNSPSSANSRATQKMPL